MDAEMAAHEFATKLALLTNSGLAWIDNQAGSGALVVLPYADQAITGNGVTFTPNLSPQYNLGEDDFLPPSQGKPPIVGTRGSPADAFNQVRVEFMDRSDEYNVAIAEAKDQASIDQYGIRPMSTVQAHWITTMAVAQFVATLILNRQLYVRNTYKFELPIKFSRLEAGDPVTLTDTALGLSNQLVRLTEVIYAKDSQQAIKCTAEEIPVGAASSPVYSAPTSSGYTADYNVAPGNVNAPVIFLDTVTNSNGWPEICFGLSGGANFGGCDIYISDDNATYLKIGHFAGKSRMGITTTSFSAVADPDNTSTLGVDLTQSSGALSNSSWQEANNFNTLCYVGPAGGAGELIAYSTAALTGGNTYNLSGLRRGVYGSPVAQLQASGASFVRMDQAVFRYAVPPRYQGRTIYFKFPAFNQYGGGLQDISAVNPTTFTLSQKFGGVPTVLPVSGLELFNQTSINTVFAGRDAKFVWRKSATQGSYELGSEPFGGDDGYVDPYFKDYKVQIIDSNGVLKRIEFVKDPFYIYTYEKNFEDTSGSPNRAFTILVWQRGSQNQLSPVPARLDVSNPQAPVPTAIAVLSGANTSAWKLTTPNVSDYAGTQVYRSTTSGFTPGPSTLVYDGPDTGGVFSGLTERTAYYYRFACYDTFDKNNLNLSSEIAGTTTFTAGGIETVTSLPAAGNLGRVVYLTTDGKLYRDNGASWDKSTDGADILANTVTAGKINVASLSAITTTTGTLIIDTAGYVRGGQTAYDTGTGFFLGYSGGVYKFSIGDASGYKLTWDGTSLIVKAKLSGETIQLTGAAGSNVLQITSDTGSGSDTKTLSLSAADVLSTSRSGMVQVAGINCTTSFDTTSGSVFLITGLATGANVSIYTHDASNLPTQALKMDRNQSVIIGSGSSTTTRTTSFLYIPTSAGAPTGVPGSTAPGRVALVYDTTNNNLYVYNGAWKKVALA